MAELEFGKSFNTQLQQVDAKYGWINDMIKARQELVLKYMAILNLSLDKNTANNPQEQCRPSYDDVYNFCNLIIDYVSHGHFDLYPKIIELMENASGRSLSIANRTMPRIEQTTDFIMKFTDKYSEDLNEKKMESIQRDLSSVGKCLEMRFKNEDRLIIALRLVHTIVQG